jgi:IclR family pca regulon transcriptional regulator
VTEVAERANVSRAAARRILFTLKCLGYVGTNESGLYRLEPAILSLGYAYISSQDLPEVARPYMETVTNELHGSSSLGVLRGTDVTFIARVRSPGYLTTTLSVGSSLPAHLTAMGRVLLADLPDEEIDDYLQRTQPEPFTDLTLTSRQALREAIDEARDSGFSLVDQELTTGVRALAVPIRTHRGQRAEAGLNIAIADPQASPSSLLDTHLPVLRRAAESIGSALGWRNG